MGKNANNVAPIANVTATAEFAAARDTLKLAGAKGSERKAIAGECSALALRVQADVATLYAVTRAWDKVHNPRADVVAGEIRDGLREAGIAKESLNLACKDALAIVRHPDFAGLRSSSEFLAAFESLELKTASAVRNHASGKVADPVATLAKQVGKLGEADRKRFALLLAAADRASGRPTETETETEAAA